MERDGKLQEFPGELKIEWKVEHCYPQKTFYSPPFYFAGASWQFRLYPETPKDGYQLCLQLSRLSFGSSLNLEVTVVRSVEEKMELPKTGTYNYIFNRFGNCHLIAQWPSKQLYENRPFRGSFPSVTLTCTLKNKDTLNITNSLIKRLSVLTGDLKELNKTGKNADLTLVSGGCKFPVHRLVLEARSAKFAQLIQKMQTDKHELPIDDINPNLMGIILDYMYTGDSNLQAGYMGITELITESEAFSTYIMAKKYELEELKEICSEFIRQHLTVDWLFDVMKFADEQGAKEVSEFATEFFVANVAEITETEGWKTFSSEHKERSIELLTYSVKKRIP